VAEAVVGAGVTVDGCLIQDGVAANAGLLDGLDSLAFLKADGTVNLTGNLAVTAGVTIDGYDLGATLDIAVLDTDIGVTVQAFDATLTSIAALGTVADRTIYTTGIDTWAETTLTAFARTLLDDVDDAAARATLDAPGLSVANAFTADQRLANDIYLTGLNAAGTTTYDLIGLNTSNRLLIGQGGPLQVDVDAAAGTFNVEDGEVTVSGALPKFKFIDTTAGHDDWSFFANASAFQIKNETSGLVALWLNSGGDFLLNSGGVQLCDQTGKLYQLGVAITATAIELNKMDGVTLTFDQINDAALQGAANTFTALNTFDTAPRIKSTAGAFYETLTNAATADRTITFPDASFTVAGRNVANTFSAGNTFSVSQDFAASFRVKAALSSNYYTLAQAVDAAQTLTLPNATTTLAGLGLVQTFSSAQTFSGGLSVTGGSHISTGLFAAGGNFAATAAVDCAGSSTSRASLRVRNGTAPTTPQDGDIWYDGTDLKAKIGGTERVFAWAS